MTQLRMDVEMLRKVAPIACLFVFAFFIPETPLWYRQRFLSCDGERLVSVTPVQQLGCGQPFVHVLLQVHQSQGHRQRPDVRE